MNQASLVSELAKPDALGLSLLQFIRRDPLAAAACFQAHCGDVAKLSILFRRIYYFFTPEAARQILVDHAEDFVREPRLLKIFESMQGRNALTTDGADWARQRRILTPGFSQKRIAGYMALMVAAARDCLQSELPTTRGETALVDVGELTTHIAMDVILRTLFSKSAKRGQAALMSDANRALTQQSMREAYWAFIPPDWMPYPGRRAKRSAVAVVHQMIASNVAARTAHAGDASGVEHSDVLAMLLAARDDAQDSPNATLSKQEIHDNCMLLFGAGFDTTASALTFWIGLMTTHPIVVARLRSELAALRASCGAMLPARAPLLEEIARLPYLNASIKEAMRLFPPSTALFTRIAMRDLVIHGTPVAKGTLTVIPIWQLHHDPRWFPEPDLFQPERFLPDAPPIPRGAFMPFGAGPHFCLGQHFASIELALVAAEIIEHFDLALDPGTALPAVTVDLALKPATPMKVRFTRR